MVTSELARRGGLLFAAVAMTGSLAACAAQPAIDYVAPTMAPEQSASEACLISSDAVDRITVETEQQIRQGIEQAGADIASGKMPAFDFLSFSVDGALAEVEQEIVNPEVLGAISELRSDLQGFGEIEQPGSLLEAPAYLGALGAQLGQLAAHGKDLRSLCDSAQ